MVEGFPLDDQGTLVFMEGSRLTTVAGRRNFGFKESTQHSNSGSRDVKVSRQLNYNTTTPQNLPLKFTPPVPCLPVWYQRSSLAKWKRAHHPPRPQKAPTGKIMRLNLTDVILLAARSVRNTLKAQRHETLRWTTRLTHLSSPTISKTSPLSSPTNTSARHTA